MLQKLVSSRKEDGVHMSDACGTAATYVWARVGFAYREDVNRLASSEEVIAVTRYLAGMKNVGPETPDTAQAAITLLIGRNGVPSAKYKIKSFTNDVNDLLDQLYDTEDDINRFLMSSPKYDI